MVNKELEQQLKEPFAQDDIEFRIARVLKSKLKAVVLAYITSRAVMDRLDSIFGIDGWTDSYEVLANGVVCKLSVKVNDGWVSKQDTAPFTNIEALKGGFSDALKRAAVKFGIGRYLYNLPEYYVELERDRPYNNQGSKVHSYYSREASGYWVEPKLPSWAVKEARQAQNTESSEEYQDSKQKAYKQEQRPLANTNKFLSMNDLPNDRTQLQSILNDYVKALVEQNALTDKKRHDYLNKINQDSANIGLLKYFFRQFTLIDKLYSLIRMGSVSESERIDIYKSIMKSNSKQLTGIEQNLNNKAA